LIALSDRLAFELLDAPLIERVAAAGSADALAAVEPEQDLVVRAARALQAAAGVRRGARIHLRKLIPLGGGLGGGSSDAATTLRVLDRLWGCRLGVDALAELGLRLGADVPVFVRGESALGAGVGEALTAMAQPEAWFLVLHPGVFVSTREVFQAPELTRNSPVITIRALSDPALRNDCEPVVRARYPAVAEALDWLGRFAPARLTGTGACVFARFDSAAAAERVAGRVPEGWRAWVTRGVARSPLLEQLEAA
jgi:4-diphosphocytidyl-2-C-methyl-D-erythritol kinase